MQKYLLAKKRLGEVMRICTLQIVITTIASGMALAHPGYAQKVLDKEVTISLTEITIESALREIEVAANVKFIYSPERLKLDETISLKAEKKKLGDVLSELLTPRGIEFIGDSKNDFVTLRPSKQKEVESGGKKTSSLESERELRPNSSVVSFATITGVVTDGSTNLPMPGVNVIVKGTTNGTSTDSEGRYTITAEDNDVLVFSFIGFTTQEILVESKSVIDIVLMEDAARLNEVIVNAGYWQVNEKENTGNIGKLNAHDIQSQPVSNPLLAMEGRIPGVYVSQTNGLAGGAISIKIRGQNSLRPEANEPFYVIDGVPFNSNTLTSENVNSPFAGGMSPLTSIDPSEIESIEVLKDADATSIYGSRGANGVILITTKKGQSGKTRFDISYQVGAARVSNTMKLLNSSQYLEMRKEAFKNDGYLPYLEDPEFDVYWPDIKMWDSTRYTDWQKTLIGGTAQTSNIKLGLSGGSKTTQFSFNGGYYKEGYVFPGEHYLQRGSGLLAISHSSLNNRVKIDFTINYSVLNNSLPNTDLTSQALTLAPNAPALYTSDGYLNWENQTWSNPLAYLKREYSNTTENLIANTNLRYEILSGISLKANIGYATTQTTETSIFPLSYYYNSGYSGLSGSAYFGNAGINSWIIEPQAEYQKSLGKGTLKLLLGGTFQESVSKGQTLHGSGYTNDALIKNIEAAPTISISSANHTEYRYSALFGRLYYDWKTRYFLNLTVRRDGSSRFGPGKQFANFGAVGFAWLFSEEACIKDNLSFLSYAKLRASIGITGSDQIGDYGYMDTYQTGQPYSNSISLVPTQLVNPDYAWETNKKAEAALELGFLEDKLLLSLSYYQHRSSNQLVGYSLPGITGFNTIQYNLPATVQNTGLEIELSSLNLKGNKFKWSSSFNITIPRNKLLEYPGLETSSYATTYVVGKPLTVANRYHNLGVDIESGTYVIEDVNQDSRISSQFDRRPLTIVGQQYFGGILNTFTYGNFNLDIFFQFVKQVGPNYLASFDIPGSQSNQPVEVMRRWQNPGDITDIQLFTLDGIGYTPYYRTAGGSSDKSFSDASFIRLKNVSISWQFPDVVLKKVKLENGRVFMQGQNLLTITKYLGMDPESLNSMNLPPLKMISAGINLTF